MSTPHELTELIADYMDDYRDTVNAHEAIHPPGADCHRNLGCSVYKAKTDAADQVNLFIEEAFIKGYTVTITITEEPKE